MPVIVKYVQMTDVEIYVSAFSMRSFACDKHSLLKAKKTYPYWQKRVTRSTIQRTGEEMLYFIINYLVLKVIFTARKPQVRESNKLICKRGKNNDKTACDLTAWHYLNTIVLYQQPEIYLDRFKYQKHFNLYNCSGSDGRHPVLPKGREAFPAVQNCLGEK